ncbi:MAG TPA: DUF2071 domain-containing protein [Terriglobales bacterium]|nr:DUF2071 domain-containing protein [Terriglobales bacterium]
MTADEILAVRSHRTYPLPQKPWVMRQEWHDLLFAHWEVPIETIRALVPPQLELDLWDGRAYLAVVPFVVRNLRPRGVPSLPVISHFAENNVRTYVTCRGIPGVWFFSLDAANLSAVLGARFAYTLPYFRARFAFATAGNTVRYSSRRLQRPKPAEFRGEYRPVSEVLEWRPPDQALERFLTERYCLYAIAAGHVYRTQIHHVPWPLQNAEARIELNTMTAPLGVRLENQPLLHFSKFQDVLVWLPERVS